MSTELVSQVGAGVAKMKESDSKLQAKVWSTLGQAASDQRTQLLAHVKALEIATAFLPSECPLLNHIILSYQKHHDPTL